MDILDEIKFYIKDEEDANRTYSRMAGDADNVGMHKTAQILRGMAADELRHKEMLEGMYYKPEFGPVREKILTEEIEEAYERAKKTGEVTVSAFRIGRPFPETYGDWVNLAEDIKTKDPGSVFMVNAALQDIASETEYADEQKRWLVNKGGELGIR